MVHGEDGQLFAGLDVDEFEFAADDGSTGVLAHTESRGSAASHIDLCDGEHEFIFRLGGIDPDTVRFEVVVFRLGVLFPYDRGYGDEDTVFVFLVKALATGVFLPSCAVDDEALEFGKRKTRPLPTGSAILGRLSPSRVSGETSVSHHRR